MTVRWGILGTANIARKNWRAMQLADNATLAAVGSRSTEKAGQFIADCQSESPFPVVPTACTYDELLARPDIDAVYVPVPTGVRRDWVVKAARAKKHVLCEKPCGPTLADLQAMVDACRENNVQFMDGVMFMHSARLPRMRAVLDDGFSVGEVRRITSQFTFAAPDEFLKQNIRVSNELEPLGALGDLGWYNIRFTLWAMKYELPVRVSGRLLYQHGSGDQPVPIEFSGEMEFASGASSSYYCSFRTELQQWGHISGSKGSLYLDDFVLPFYGSASAFTTNTPIFNVKGTRYHMESHPKRYDVPEYSDGSPNAQETNMIRTFSALVQSRKLDPFWPEVALKTQLIMDRCLESARQGGEMVRV